MTPHQLSFPDIPASTPRRKTRHTFKPSAEAYARAECKSCAVQRRYGPFGHRNGYCHQWSLDGKEWSTVEIPCALKGSG